MDVRVRASLGLSLMLVMCIAVLAFAACGDDESVAGEPASVVAGAGGAQGGNGPGPVGPGGSGNGGSAGAGPGGSAPLAAGNELNAANGQMTGSSYSLVFQLGRSFHQPRASAGANEIECAAPVH